MAVLTFSGERRALMSERNTHLHHPDLATLVSSSARTCASFSPTTPSLSILCRRFFPVINFLPSPSLATTWGAGGEINHWLPWWQIHPMWRGVCVLVAPVACQRCCCWLAGTCLSTRQSAGGLGWGLHLHSERLWQLSAWEALTWHTRLKLLCKQRWPSSRGEGWQKKKRRRRKKRRSVRPVLCLLS